MPRILRSSPAIDQELIVRALDELGANPQCLKQDDETAVFMVRVGDRELIVKRWSLRRPKRRLQALLRSTPAFRHWRGARWLEEARIPTAACLAIVRDQQAELLVMERLPGKTVLQHLADNDLSPRQQHRLAEAIGAQIVRLRQRGKGNRDHKASNLIVNGEIRENAKPRIAVIDCVGVRRRADARSMAKALVAECLGTGVLPRRAVLMRCVWAMAQEFGEQEAETGEGLDPLAKRQVRRMIWRDTRRTIARHGDPTPKVNPLQSSRATDRASGRGSERSVR